MRADILIKEKFGVSRSKARELIENGCVLINGIVVKKTAFNAEADDNIEITDSDKVLKYVSRGGYKLEKAITQFGISLKGKKCIDIGASTGGFTDCMLQNGAAKIFAVDVGTSQLVDTIRENPAVTVLENTDIRDVTTDITGTDISFVCADVSFISLEKIMESVAELLCFDGTAVLLVKPQFEAGRAYISSGGIVKNPKVHRNVIMNVIACAKSFSLGFKDLTYSPIKGGSGNTEYLLYLCKNQNLQDAERSEVERVVELALKELK